MAILNRQTQVPLLTERYARIILVIVLAVANMACSTPLQPDFERLYGVVAASPDETPVILIPGLFGSKLRDRRSALEVWPGNWRRLLFSDYEDLALDFDPVTLKVRPDHLEAFDIADSVLGQDFYGPIVRTLVDFGGYVRATPGTPATKGKRRLYVFAYDWRQDNVEQARGLEAMIDTIRVDHGNPNLRVDIVAHSMGGLIAHYYLRFGTRDVLDGAPALISPYGTQRVRKLILLGTPNFGAVSALHGYLEGEPVGFGRIQPEVLATMPSGYQLFPHPLAYWLINASGRELPDELFDPVTWRRNAWNVHDPEVAARALAKHGAEYLYGLRRYFAYRLERARRFAWMLSTPEPETRIRYVLFGGDCTLTPARILIEHEAGEVHTHLSPPAARGAVARGVIEKAMLEPGDGRVTKPSLLARETIDPTAP